MSTVQRHQRKYLQAAHKEIHNQGEDVIKMYPRKAPQPDQRVDSPKPTQSPKAATPDQRIDSPKPPQPPKSASDQRVESPKAAPQEQVFGKSSSRPSSSRSKKSTPPTSARSNKVSLSVCMSIYCNVPVFAVLHVTQLGQYTGSILQGCHSQGNSRSGKSQGILEFIREIWNFAESQGNLRKVMEIYNIYIS